MADLAKLVVRLEAQSAQMIAELEKANSKVDRFASQTNKTLNKWAGGLLAVFSGKAILAWTKNIIDAQDNLNDMSQKAGESVERVSALGYAASQSGSDLEGLANGLRKLSSNAADAANGSKSAAAAFDSIGVKVTDSNGALKSSGDLLLEIAEQFEQYEDGAGKSALATDLFGKAGADLIPFLNKGAAGIKELTAQADRLGITVSTKSAQAADDFNDSLDKLQKTAAGLVGGSLADGLKVITDAFNQLSENGADVERFSAQVETGFKLVVDIGYSVYKTFDDIGTSLGALAAAAVAFATGEFKRARDIIKMAQEDQVKSEAEANAFLDKLWSDRAATVANSANAAADAVVAADAKVKKTFIYGGDKKSPVDEVAITGAEKIEDSPMAKFYDELDKKTQTQSERAIAAYNEQRAAITALYEDGKISLETYDARVKESLDTLLPEFEVTAKKVTEIGAGVISEFDKAVAQNSVDIIADTLVNGFDDGAEGVLRSFAVMLQKLAAQALAAELGKKIFGAAGGSGGSGDGWLGMALNAAGSYFGFSGARAAGGAVNPGGMLRVNELGQEGFVPDRPGQVVSAAEMAAPPQVNVPLQVVNVDDPSKIPNFFKSERGSQTFLNLLTDNRQTVRQVLQGG